MSVNRYLNLNKKRNTLVNSEIPNVTIFFVARRIIKQNKLNETWISILYLLTLWKQTGSPRGLSGLHIYSLLYLNNRSRSRKDVTIGSRELVRMGYVNEYKAYWYEITAAGEAFLKDLDKKIGEARVYRNRSALPGYKDAKKPKIF